MEEEEKKNINIEKDLKKMNDTEKDDLADWVETKVKVYTDARFKYERNWYLADNFWDGNHFVWWRESTGTIDRVKPPKGTMLRQVPKLKKQFEAMTNLIVANDPRWVAYPDIDEGQVQNEVALKKAIDYSIKRRKWLENVWDTENIKGKTIDWVTAALKFPHATMEVYTDPVTKKQKVAVWEPFDTLWKPDVDDIEDSPIFIKCVQRKEEDIRVNTDYVIPKDMKFVLEERFASSDMKEMRQMEKFGNFGVVSKEGTGILKECYIKDFDKEDKPIMRLVSVFGGKVIRNSIVPYKRYPFSVLKLQSGPYYQQSFLESLIPTNKSIDLITSNIETFFHTMTRGKYLKHKNSTVTRVTNENGDFIEYDIDKPEQLQLANIPSYVFNHLANLEKWIEERTVSAATTGKVPRGIRAYKAIEALKQSDFANVGTPVTFLEEALEKVAELILEQADNYIDQPQQVQRLNEENPDYFSVVGQSSYAETMGEDVVPISAETRIDVKIESGLSYTEEGKRQTMLELYQLGLVPAEEVLKSFRFSNVGQILNKAIAEKQMSMIDTPDFQALPDQLKMEILKVLQGLNINLPQNPAQRTEAGQPTPSRVTRNTGPTKTKTE
jgi:hypothetical protein